MKRDLSRIIVVDLEATCWEPKDSQPNNETSEIIEIGACLLNHITGERSNSRGIIVKPIVSRVTKFCTELTSLTQEDVDAGITYAEACSIVRSDYAGKKRTWAAYGAYDKVMVERMCKMFNVPYPFGASYINVKNLIALKMGWTKEVGMAKALTMLDIELEGRHHRGVDDAWNTAAILSRCFNS